MQSKNDALEVHVTSSSSCMQLCVGLTDENMHGLEILPFGGLFCSEWSHVDVSMLFLRRESREYVVFSSCIWKSNRQDHTASQQSLDGLGERSKEVLAVVRKLQVQTLIQRTITCRPLIVTLAPSLPLLPPEISLVDPCRETVPNHYPSDFTLSILSKSDCIRRHGVCSHVLALPGSPQVVRDSGSVRSQPMRHVLEQRQAGAP